MENSSLRLIDRREVQWITSTILNEFLGLSINLGCHSESHYVITHDDQALVIQNSFFPCAKKFWLDCRSFPVMPLETWDLAKSILDVDLEDSLIPVLYGKPEFHINASGNGYLGLDVFGSAFFMMSRYEEMVLSDADLYDRFPALSSFAYKSQLLTRPIIDEYVEILWAAIKQVWPSMARKTERGQVMVSCDVDRPFDPSIQNYSYLLKSSVKDIFVNNRVKSSYRKVENYFRSKKDDYSLDNYYTFDWYMDMCERYDHKTTFYFISNGSGKTYDGWYRLRDNRIQRLIKKVGSRGHEIGMHGSYYSYLDSELLKIERDELCKTCRALNVDDSVSGNRQHYLRWKTPITLQALEAAGFEYDSTGGYAETPGFRYGTSRTFKMWNWEKCAPSLLYQRPLIAMDVSLIGESYLGISDLEEALDMVKILKNRSIKYGGNFVLLWHNSSLTEEWQRWLFKNILSNIA
jgi:peptidoglycan/xylan/chitin deacetylase (PgdA/CDA1 family)